MGSNGNLKRIEGERFGNLLVIEREGATDDRYAAWRCRCTCGVEVVVSGHDLRRWKRQSCAVNGHYWKLSSKHNSSKPEYRNWLKMRERCLNPKNHRYPTYGGKGIMVCERWKLFDNFLEDMGQKPSPKHTLDRYPNREGNYEPGNVRWATAKEQRHNSARNVLVEHEWKKVNLATLCEKLGLSRSTIYGRLKNGWSLDEALTIPMRVKKKEKQE